MMSSVGEWINCGTFRWASLNRSTGKESACNTKDTGDEGSIPGLRSSPGGRNGNPLLYSCLENPIDRGAWQATAHGVAKNGTQLSD